MEFVLQRKGNVLALRAIAQRRIVNLNLFHGTILDRKLWKTRGLAITKGVRRGQ
jgi:hypothetical protein